MKKIIFVYGLLAAVLCTGLIVFMPKEMTEENMITGMIVGYTFFFLSAVLISFGIASYKKNVLGGSISYLKAISVGLLTCLVASTIYVGVWMAVYKPFFPNFAKTYAPIAAKHMREGGESEEDIKKMYADMDKYDKEPAYRALITYSEPLFMQVPVVLIASIFISMRRRKQTTTA